MADQLVFYTNPQSRGQIVRWMLEEVGVDYQEKIIEYGPAMKSPEYLQINPMGKVPAISYGDKVITECPAIVAFLAEQFGESELAPRADERADYYRWMFYAAGPLESALTNKSLGVEPSDEQQRMAGYGNYSLVIDVLDDWLSTHDYVCGSRFTAADVYLGSHVDFGMLFGTLEERDSFKAYAQRLRQRPAYTAAKARDQALMS